jgi:hypothetical protein
VHSSSSSSSVLATIHPSTASVPTVLALGDDQGAADVSPCHLEEIIEGGKDKDCAAGWGMIPSSSPVDAPKATQQYA